MGLKRKASALEETSFHQPSSPPSLVSASTSSSPSSMCTEPFNSTQSDSQRTNREQSAPWLNLRTRKRVRDNRPSEEQVRSSTIRKLFDAQKRDVDEAMLPMEDEDLDMAMDTDMIEYDAGVPIEVSLEPEPNQRSLHDFFPMERASSEPPKQRGIHDFFSAPIATRAVPQDNQASLDSMFAINSRQPLAQPAPFVSEMDVEVPGGRHRHDWGWPRM